eukprot:Skav234244  [mRNA]  locus=scaffold1464:541399:546763:- [translate_table: standard]
MTLRAGDDAHGEGIYTGRIVLPVNYPLAPPSITLLTPSGRWEVGKKICLSNTNYHAELWQPAWGIRTMMEAPPPLCHAVRRDHRGTPGPRSPGQARRSHFPVAGDGAIGTFALLLGGTAVKASMVSDRLAGT